ncbi:MAG: anti-sigma factor [Alphaproteobacteria bacterium]
MNDELSELEQLAAEYVLGSLGADERRRVEEQMRRDAELARLVQEWTLRLVPIIEAVPPVAPPARVWQRIEAVRGPAGRPAAATSGRFWERIGFWRWSTAMAAAAAVALVLHIATTPPPPVSEGRYVALLGEEVGAPAWMVTVDTDAGRLTVKPFAPLAVEDKAFELWLVIDAETPPRSLGLISPVQEVTLPLAPELTEAVPAAALAISLEPPGGSPSGLPTGPVLYQGVVLPLKI